MAPVVRVSRRYGSAAEEVFDAWLDPTKARQFLFATDTGKMVRVDIDAGCELTLTHEMKPQYAEFVDKTRQGWTRILESLARIVGETKA